MFRPPIALVAFLISTAALPSLRAQDPAPAVCDKNFWSADPAPAKPVPPPIVPEHWLVLPRDANTSVAQVFARHLLDPKSPAPAAGTDGLAWKSAESKHPAGIVAAFTRIASERDEVRMARLTGAELLFVNGDAFVGDVDGRGFRGVPVALKKGDNELLVLGVPDSFELELWVPQTRAVLASWDVAWPGDNPIADDIAYPVFNASLEAAPNLHVHYGHARAEGSTCERGIGDWRDTYGMPPLGVRMGGSYFLGFDECDPRDEERAALVPLCVYVGGDCVPDAQTLRCPPASERKRSRASGLPQRNASRLLGSPLSALSTEFVLVYPRSETPGCARFDQQLCWYRAWFTPETISGEELVSVEPGRDALRAWASEHAWSFQNVVLYGNAETNPAWPRLVPDEGPIQVHEGHLKLKGKHYASDDICGWFRFTASSGKHVVVAASTGARGARLACLVQPLFAQAAGLDYCFWDARGEGGTPREFASGRLPSVPADKRDR